MTTTTVHTGQNAGHRVVIVGNDAECRCDRIKSHTGGRTTHLRSHCSPDTVFDQPREVISR
jgi:hypothetical protein